MGFVVAVALMPTPTEAVRRLPKIPGSVASLDLSSINTALAATINTTTSTDGSMSVTNLLNKPPGYFLTCHLTLDQTLCSKASETFTIPNQGVAQYTDPKKAFVAFHQQRQEDPSEERNL